MARKRKPRKEQVLIKRKEIQNEVKKEPLKNEPIEHEIKVDLVEKKHEPIKIIVIIILVGLIGLGVAAPFIFRTDDEPEIYEEEPHVFAYSRDIFTLYSQYNITVVIQFEEEMPNVQFVNPQGNKIDMSEIRYRHGGNFIQYFIPNAAIGTWSMLYDTNEEIITKYSVYMNHMFIHTFTASANLNAYDYMPFSLIVSSDENIEFEYQIHAVFTDEYNEIVEEILLVRGFWLANQELLIDADVSRLVSNGFMVRATAEVRHGQALVTDTAWQDLRSAIFQRVG